MSGTLSGTMSGTLIEQTITSGRRAPLSMFGKFWWWLRQVTGDAAYENYLHHAARASREKTNCPNHPPGNIVTAEQFYLDRLNRKFARVSRCC